MLEVGDEDDVEELAEVSEVDDLELGPRARALAAFFLPNSTAFSETSMPRTLKPRLLATWTVSRP